jgi:AMME syndrome candidate gene 1 protein
VLPSYASHLSATESYPLFVTWNTISRTSGDKRLRGCIGTFDPLPLETGLQSYSLTSAFEDTRFSPIPSALLSSLSCSLTLLAGFEPCQDAMDWVLGRHGIRISFTHRSRRHGATYLPDVAVEQGWSKEETVESLMKKAGWDGGSSHGGGYARRILRGSSRSDEAKGKPWDEVADFRTVRYTGLKATATYSEWQEWRSWIDRQPGISLK